MDGDELEVSCHNLTEVVSGNFPGGTEEDDENLGQDDPCTGKYFNRTPFEYKF
jgi:hypothetical protein